MKKTWRVEFTHSVVKEWELGPGEDINIRIKNYLHEQNKGEAKSDRLHLIKKTRIIKAGQYP